MADPALLGLALANAQGGYDAYNRGTEDANRQFLNQVKAREVAMDLALKDANLEDRQVRLGMELLSSMPLRNEPMIRDYAAQSIEPLKKIKAPVASSGDPDLQRRLEMYARDATADRDRIGLNVPDLGVGAGLIKDSYNQRQRVTPQDRNKTPARPLSKQEQAIERLRSTPQRSPQGVVTPDEWSQDETFKALLAKTGHYDAVMRGSLMPWQATADGLTEGESWVFEDIKGRLLDRYFGMTPRRVYDPAKRARIINHDAKYPFIPQRSPQSVGDSLYLGRGDREVPGTRTSNWEFQLGQAPVGVQVQNEDPNVITASPLEYAQEQSIVQPLEGGGYQPGDLDDSASEIGLQRLEDERDPRVEDALNNMAASMDGSPYTALRDPRLRREMFDAMYRASRGFQSNATLDALKSLDQTGFLAQKSAAQLNQQGAQTEAKLEINRLNQELSNMTRMAGYAARAQDAEAQRALQMEITAVRAMISTLQNQNPRPSSRGGKEDPDVVDYRKQMNQFSQRLSSMEAEVIKKYGVLNSRSVQRLVKTNSREWGPVLSEAQRLYNLGKSSPKYSGVLNNYKGLGSIVGDVQGGTQPTPRGSNQSRAAEALRARGVK